MMINEIAFLKALSNQVAPCDKFKCEFRQTCSDKKMACRAFESFISCGKANFEMFLNFPLPSKTIYTRIFSGE